MPKYNSSKIRKRPFKLRRILNFIVFIGFLIALANIVHSLISSSQYYSTIHNNLRTKPFFNVKHEYQCEKLIDGDFDHLPGGNKNLNLRRILMNDKQMWKLFGNCSRLFDRHYYPEYPLTIEERDYPLAYVLLVNEHLEQLEILLNAIYAPQNVYCIHVDFKSSYLFHNAIERLSSCFSNVFIPRDRIAISHGGVSMLHAQQSCLKELYYGRDGRQSKFAWKYVFLLQGHDFPLKTNGEIVEILKIHNGANDVELLPTPTERFAHKYEGIFDGMGYAFDFRETNEDKQPPPHGLTIYKGSVATFLNRETVKFALENVISEDLLAWLNDTLMPDELFWSTLNHNEVLEVPGGYPGRCVQAAEDGYKTWISRFAVWEQYEHLHCNGSFRHSVCLFNCGDLPMLSKRPELFLNKFWIHSDSVAMDCMHELLFNRTYRRSESMKIKYFQVNVNFYKSLSSVAFRDWSFANPTGNSSQFRCVVCRKCSH